MHARSRVIINRLLKKIDRLGKENTGRRNKKWSTLKMVLVWIFIGLVYKCEWMM